MNKIAETVAESSGAALDPPLSRFRGCLLGGAVGKRGHTDDDTRLTLHTAEGLLEGWRVGCERGSESLLHATRRAYRQGQDDDCLATLRAQREPGAVDMKERKGCGGLTRAAPAGLFFWRPQEACSMRPAFRLGAELAGLTHGHPTGQLTAGVLAVLVLALADGMRLSQALAVAKKILATQPAHEETLRAIEHAECLARSPIRRPEAIAALGQGWQAEEALAIAIYCALVSRVFEEGVMLAVGHDGDTGSTGSVAGQLLGTLHGVQAIPPQWLEPLELRELISETADELYGYWIKTPGDSTGAAATAP